MCEGKAILSFMFFIKIIVLIIIPLIILINKKINPNTKMKLINVEIAIVSLFIILRVTNNSCIVNSSIEKIGIDLYRKSTSVIKEKNSPDIVEEIVTNKKYKTKNLSDVYYFNNNIQPLSDKKITCNGETKYMKQYGNGITTVSMMVSTILNQNIDPIEILNLAVKNDIFDCNTGVNINLLLNVVSEEYRVTFREIDSESLWDTIYSGNVVLEEAVFKKDAPVNLTCGKGYLLIYSVDNNYDFQILNPNNSANDYICPDNTPGYMTIIKANSNDSIWTLNQLNEIKSRFIIGERN